MPQTDFLTYEETDDVYVIQLRINLHGQSYKQIKAIADSLCALAVQNLKDKVAYKELSAMRPADMSHIQRQKLHSLQYLNAKKAAELSVKTIVPEGYVPIKETPEEQRARIAAEFAALPDIKE